MSGNLEQALAELNLSPDVDTSVLEKLDMEFNLPERGMSSARISELQSETANGISDVLRFGVYDEEESIVESKEEAVDREVSIRSQLTIALRYLDQLLEIDSQVCGVSDALGEAGVGGIESTTGGIKMPMRNIKENGENITVEAKNSWGSDPDSKDRSKDMPILTRGDKVNFFDSKDRYIGSGEVKFAERGNIHLSAHSSVVFRKGCYIKKASNKGTLIRYKKKVAMFCRQMEHVPTDKMGIDYNLDLIEELKVKRVTRLRPYTGVLYEVDEEQIPELNVAESAFLGRGDNQYLGRNNLKSEDIPRSILGDPEQCAAFALGASGYPCFLIQGPSGTGKTTVASNIAKLNQSKGRRTLIVSHSNKGLDVLLGATKKIGAAVHRAGTHIESCRKDLREDFMRKGLKYPVKSEFISYEFDKESYDKACRGAEVGKKPYRETFTDVIFDEEDYDQAISDFKSRKKDIVDKLKEERGLIVGVTLTTLLTDEIIKELDFDTVIVDEASRGYIYELLPALEKAGKQKIGRAHV